MLKKLYYVALVQLDLGMTCSVRMVYTYPEVTISICGVMEYKREHGEHVHLYRLSTSEYQ